MPGDSELAAEIEENFYLQILVVISRSSNTHGYGWCPFIQTMRCNEFAWGNQQSNEDKEDQYPEMTYQL